MSINRSFIRFVLAWVALAALALSSACSPRDATPAARPTVEPVTPTAAATQAVAAPTQPPTGSPTQPPATPGPSAPPSTPTPRETSSPSPTPTEKADLAITQRQALVYAGPGEPYPLLVTYAAGLTFPVLGKSAAGDWLIIPINPYQTGWIASLDVSAEADLESLAVVLPDPAAIPTPNIVQAKVKVSVHVEYLRNNPGLVTITLTDMTPGIFYQIEVFNPKGKRIKRISMTGTESGKDHDWLEGGTLPAGQYTVIVTGSNGESVQKQFSLERNK